MAEKKKKKAKKVTEGERTSPKANVAYQKGDTVVTTGQYPPFPEGTQAKVLDVDPENNIATVQLMGDPGVDTESAIIMHPIDFFEKQKRKRGRPRKAA